MSKKNLNVIYGHDQILDLFFRARANDRLSHAYLLAGPQGVGKYTVAAYIARSLVCMKASEAGEPCTVCMQCLATNNEMHPDIIVLRGDPEKKEIGIEHIRTLRSAVEQTSFFAGYRVAIIDEADTLTQGASNALLKILEEPRGKTIFFLLASNGNRVMSTVRSRTVVINLDPLDTKRVQSILLERGVDRHDAEAIAFVSRGRIGMALALAANPARWNAFIETGDMIIGMLDEKTWTARRRIIEKDIDAVTTPEALAFTHLLLHSILAGAMAKKAPVMPSSPLFSRIAGITKKGNWQQWSSSLRSFAALITTLQTTNTQPLFAFEQFLFSLPSSTAL